MLAPALRLSLEQAVTAYETQMTDRARSYLASRGIDGETVTRFRLGSVQTPEIGHDQYAGMVCIPYLAKMGPVALKFRDIEGGEPKYLIPAGQPTRMFNARAALSTGSVIAVAEGELDAISLEVAGIPAVGIPGVNAWKRHHYRVLDGFSRVWVFADNDVKEDGSNPGRELAKRIMQDLPQAVMVSMPPGRDVNDLLVNDGPEALRALIGFDPPISL